jgi:4-oxalomesaconate tautomerase
MHLKIFYCHKLWQSSLRMPHVVHEAIGVLAAISVDSACVIHGTDCNDLIKNQDESFQTNTFSIEHPSGEFTVNLDYEKNEFETKIIKSVLIRTAKLIAKGKTFIY